MPQNLDVTIPQERYTRADFAALRAWLNRIALSTIKSLYYHEDDLWALGIETNADLSNRMSELCENLVHRESLRNPHLSSVLTSARATQKWSPKLIDFLVHAAEQDLSKPKPDDALTVWFKPRFCRVLREEGVLTVQDLKELIRVRGPNWWRPIPLVGKQKAEVLVAWLKHHVESLGPFSISVELIVPDQEVLHRGVLRFVPLEQIGGLDATVDGHDGHNRNERFCQIGARNDLEAIQAYLYKFRGHDKTLRAYRKELERFLLWCTGERGIALSSVLHNDCEAYKDFLALLPDAWIAPKSPRRAGKWRPFSAVFNPETLRYESHLTIESQRYATQVLRTFFEWLVNVRYLGGNPWRTVADPDVPKREYAIDIDKALPSQFWEQIAQTGGLLDRVCGDSGEPDPLPPPLMAPVLYQAREHGARRAQYRLARAAILLLGYSGLRREEASQVTRNYLRPAWSEDGVLLWELPVLGKGNKWRTVLLPDRAVHALRAHWVDRGHDFEASTSTLALLSPVVVPNAKPGQDKHVVLTEEGATLSGKGFTPDGLYQVVKTTLIRMARDPALDITADERFLLERAAPHALRHTFATYAITSAAVEVPTLQRLMGHESQSTTSIYVRAEKRQSLREIGALYGKGSKTV